MVAKKIRDTETQHDSSRALQRSLPRRSIEHTRKIIFGLGSNLGDREFYLDEAVKELELGLFLQNLKRSKIFKNPAMLLVDSPAEWNLEFFNIALSADIEVTKFSPEKILEIVKRIEKKLGRIDRERWAPREIDIDILLIEGLKISIGQKLVIPHPGLLERDFFLQTVNEIEPEFLSPFGIFKNLAKENVE